jgi:hypothetical protein
MNTAQWLLVLAGCCSMAAQAATFRVDDSHSTVLDPSLSLQWRTLSPASGDHVVQGMTRVHVRLDTSTWVGQFGRIYMSLPPQPNGAVTAEWRTQQGQLLPGTLVSGQRGLVWSGVLTKAILDDVLQVTIRADGRLLASAQMLRFHFEIDLP